MIYCNVHRFFLRTIASQGVLTYSDALEVLDHSFPDREETSIEDLTKDINNNIRPYNQEIKIVKDEVTSERYVVFLSLAYDDASKSQTMFSPQELEFFRILIEEIMTAESREITPQSALNLVNKLKVSKSDAQKLLNTWCRMHYLVQTETNYALGIRAIHEFKNYFLQNMNNFVQECHLCRDIVVRGHNCIACDKAIHTRCLTACLQNAQKWPCCDTNFDPAQLENLTSEQSMQTQNAEETRAQPSQRLNSTHLERDDTSDEEFDYVARDCQPGVSLKISRKRKRSNR